jgi:NADH-quinone oxidoreductase subunit C
MTSEDKGQGGTDGLPERAGEDRLSERVVRRGSFGITGSGDTSGYGRLQVRRPPLLSTPQPYGSYFDEVTDRLGRGLEASGTQFGDAVEAVVVDRGELTLHIKRDRLPDVARRMRDDPALRFELCSGVSGVHYPDDQGRELHAVYHLVSLTHNRRVRLEVSAPDADPHVPSIVSIFPGFLRDHLRRAPRADPDRDARRLEGPPPA